MQTNFFPFEIAGDSFQSQTLSYSSEKLRELRQNHNSTYSFFRFCDLIIVSPHDQDAPQLGEYRTFNPISDTALVSSLLRHLLFQEFRRKISNVLLTSFAPLEFRSRKDTHDPTKDLIPKNLQKIVSYPRVISISVEQIIQDAKPKYGLLISYRSRWNFSLSLTDLQKQGFPIVGCEVLAIEPMEGLQGVLAPKESLLGIVREIKNEVAVVQTNDGLIEYSCEQLTIRRTRQQLATFLNLTMKQTETDALFRGVRAYSERQANPDNIIKEIREVGNWIAKLNFCNGDTFFRMYN